VTTEKLIERIGEKAIVQYMADCNGDFPDIDKDATDVAEQNENDYRVKIYGKGGLLATYQVILAGVDPSEWLADLAD